MLSNVQSRQITWPTSCTARSLTAPVPGGLTTSAGCSPTATVLRPVSKRVSPRAALSQEGVNAISILLSRGNASSLFTSSIPAEAAVDADTLLFLGEEHIMCHSYRA